MKDFKLKTLLITLFGTLTLSSCLMFPGGSETSDLPSVPTSHNETMYRTTFLNYDDSFLYATWTKHGEDAVYKGATPTRPETATYSFVFNGWDKSLMDIKEDSTFIAKYREEIIVYHDVIFVDYDYELLYSTRVRDGGDAVYEGKPPARERANNQTYTFNGWNKSLSNISEYTIFVAQYIANVDSHLVRFFNYDNTLLDAVYVYHGDTAVYTGKTPIRPATEGASYEFIGWDRPLRNIQGPTDFTAEFNVFIREFTVNFLNYDGEPLYETTVSYGNDAYFSGNEPTRKPEGRYAFTFKGWDRSIKNVTSDLEVYAEFNTVERKTSDGFYFAFNSEKRYYEITGYGGSEQDLYIGGTHDTIDYGRYPIRVIRSSAFSYNGRIRSVFMENSITNIGSSAFYYCENLEDVTLSLNLVSIEHEAFYQTKIKNIEIPPSVSLIGYQAFYTNRVNDTNITIHPDNPHLSSENNILMNKAKTVIMTKIGYINVRNLIIPEGVEVINDDAIQNTNITSLTLPSTLKELKHYSLAYNYSLQKLTINDAAVTIGYGAFAYCHALETIDFGSNLIRIEADAFYNNSLSSISLPGSLTSISEQAFKSCYNLREISIDSANENYKVFDGALYNATLTNLVILPIGRSNQITLASELNAINVAIFNENKFSAINIENNEVFASFDGALYSKAYETLIVGPGTKAKITLHSATNFIGYEAFYGNKNLTTIVFNEQLNTINERAFHSSELKELNFPTSLKIIKQGAFSSSINITKITFNEGLELIGEDAFYNCESVTKLTFPDSLLTIKSSAFRYMYNLTEVNFNDDLQTIESYAFSQNNSLKTITFNENLQSIGSWAFENNQALKSVMFGPNLTTIGSYAFYYCNVLENIMFGEGLETIKDAAFYSTKIKELTFPENLKKIESSAFANSSLLKIINFNDELSEIGSYAFENCDSLENLVLPKKLTTVNYGTFQYNNNLKSITFNENLTLIHFNAFKNCPKLERLVFNEKLEHIYSYAFENCTNLKYVEFNKNLKYIEAYAFSNCPNIETIILSSGLTAFSGSELNASSKLSEIYYGGASYNAALDYFTDVVPDIDIYYFSETPIYDGQHWRYVDGVPTIWVEEIIPS